MSRKILNAVRDKRHVSYKGREISMIANFSSQKKAGKHFPSKMRQEDRKAIS